MKITTHLFAAVAGSALLVGAAAAQQATGGAATEPPMSAESQDQAPTGDPAAQTMGADDGATASEAAPETMPSPSMSVTTSDDAMGSPDSAVNPPPAGAVPVSSAALGDPATLKAGDPGVVSNGPVPDTAENRAKYGEPKSRAGKLSKAAGN